MQAPKAKLRPAIIRRTQTTWHTAHKPSHHLQVAPDRGPGLASLFLRCGESAHCAYPCSGAPPLPLLFRSELKPVTHCLSHTACHNPSINPSIKMQMQRRRGDPPATLPGQCVPADSARSPGARTHCAWICAHRSRRRDPPTPTPLPDLRQIADRIARRLDDPLPPG